MTPRLLSGTFRDFELLKLNCDELVSKFALKCKLRPCTWACRCSPGGSTAAPTPAPSTAPRARCGLTPCYDSPNHVLDPQFWSQWGSHSMAGKNCQALMRGVLLRRRHGSARPTPVEEQVPQHLHLLHLITSSPQHLNTSAPQYLNASTPQRLSTSTPQHLNASTPQHLNTSTPQHLNTSTPQRLITSSPHHPQLPPTGT